jgi:hypothetical protein
VKLSEPKIGSILEIDTSSEARLVNFRPVVRTHTLPIGMQLGLCHCRIFEAGESDIGHTDAAGSHPPASSSGDAQHAELVSAVKVAGLSSSATVQDVANFLDGLELRRGLDSAVFLGDQRSRKAALVELANDTAVQLTLSKNNQVFGNARLQVVQLTASEIALFLPASAAGFSLQDRPITQHHAEDWSQQQQQLPAVRAQQTTPMRFRMDGSTLKMRGLPYSASVSDILHFFKGALATACVSDICAACTSLHWCRMPTK